MRVKSGDMRRVAYLLFFFSLYNFGKGIYDQSRGVATLRVTRRSIEQVVSKEEDQVGFQNLISNRWARGAIFFLGGIFVLGLARRIDASDPFSPDLGGNAKQDPVDPVLEDELRKRRTGLR